ncbi:MAG: helix-turn-helix transcriptional regulator [Clostridia bacterium]|nr:helix-turn-helix transcriptional regulator [Clostridia bacterium]
MATEHEKALTREMAALLAGDPGAQEPAPEGVYAWRLLRWEADVPLTDDQREALLEGVEDTMAPAGAAAACFAADGDVMTIMLALTRFPAKVHRDTVLWLCAHALMEHASVNLEQDGTMFIGEEFASAGEWIAHLAPMREISQWWRVVSPIGGSLAHTHRTHLQTSIKRRQYAALGGYVSRVLRTETELSRVCFGFIPLVIEAIWSQHAEASLQSLTGKLKLAEMTRHPREALLEWLASLQPVLRACPATLNSAPIDRVIESIRQDCSLPYSQANLSRSLGLTPAYFCRLFHEKTGQHFSTFLTRTRMEKAQYLLSGPEDMTLAEISAACGYPNKSYFCQVFKKYTGMTPGEFESTYKDV